MFLAVRCGQVNLLTASHVAIGEHRDEMIHDGANSRGAAYVSMDTNPEWTRRRLRRNFEADQSGLWVAQKSG